MTVAGVDWSNLHVAGAFILGAVLAALATLRLVRAVLGVLGVLDPSSSSRRRRRPPDTEPEDEREA